MNNLRYLFAAALLILSANLKSQTKAITFGEVPREDVEMKTYEPDPGADAVFLEDYGRAHLSLDAEYNIQTVFEHHIRIKIINSNGFDYADFKKIFYSSGRLDHIQAATYNIENGEVVATKVERKNIYYTSSSNQRRGLSFTFPDVRVGSVLELKYTFTSYGFYDLFPWYFQKEIPVRHGGYLVEIPGYFAYKITATGNLEKIKFSKKEERVEFGNQFVEGLTAQWSYSGMPAYRPEIFSTGSDDYVARVNFELAKIDIPGHYYKDVSPTYARLSELLLDDPDFGNVLKGIIFLSGEAKKLTANAKSDTEKMKLIYDYVSQNFIWNDQFDAFISQPLRKTFVKGRGNSADINMLFIALCRTAGVPADPVILSTRENGKLNRFFPVMQQFNDVIAQVRVDGQSYLVDATDPLRSFDMLPMECLNEVGWLVVSSGSGWVDLKNNERENTLTNYNIELSRDGIFSGNVQSVYSGYDGYTVRQNLKYAGESGYKDILRHEYGNRTLDNFEWSNIADLGKPVVEKCEITINNAVEKIGSDIAFMPVFMNEFENNPFFSEERLSPVDFGCPKDFKYSANILIPDGYNVVELPATLKLALPHSGGSYIFNATTDGKAITIQVSISRTSVSFEREDYELLREFWARIIQKQQELVILRPNV